MACFSGASGWGRVEGSTATLRSGPDSAARCLLPFLVPSSRPFSISLTRLILYRDTRLSCTFSRSHPVPEHRPNRKRPPRRSGACRVSHQSMPRSDSALNWLCRLVQFSSTVCAKPSSHDPETRPQCIPAESYSTVSCPYQLLYGQARCKRDFSFLWLAQRGPLPTCNHGCAMPRLIRH